MENKSEETQLSGTSNQPEKFFFLFFGFFCFVLFYFFVFVLFFVLFCFIFFVLFLFVCFDVCCNHMHVITLKTLSFHCRCLLTSVV